MSADELEALANLARRFGYEVEQHDGVFTVGNRLNDFSCDAALLKRIILEVADLRAFGPRDPEGATRQ